ncbi:MAG: sulfatase [Planctomycetota bacterium]|nr:MAG: sulfatase [Planctomycetota bacterium]
MHGLLLSFRRPAAAAALSVLASLAAAAGAADRPNIVFIFSDDHGYQAISAYGHGLNHTPNIDRLAQEGMRFDRCYVTNSICGPSRAVILTGKYSHKNCFFTNADRFDGSQQTFPKLLRQAGYQTAIFGKWHLQSDPTGFDRWEVLPGQGRYYSPVFITPHGRVTEPGYVADVITDKALKWLREERDANKPFMLMVQHKSPHREWEPGPAHVGDFKDVTIPEPATLFDDYANRADAARMATMRMEDLNLQSDLKVFDPESDYGKQLLGRMSAEERAAWIAAYKDENAAFLNSKLEGQELIRWKFQRYVKDYLRTVQSVDDSVGKVLDYLDEAGLAENTVVVYASDQGFYLGEHGWFDKRFMYEQSLRTPLLIRWPGVTKGGATDDHIVSNLDFAETLLDMAGVAIPPDMQGRSLAPILRGAPPDDWRKSFYYHYYEGPPAPHTVAEHYGVTDGRYKLIHYYTLDQWELFDLVNDPHEMQSVYGHPDYARPRQRLQDELSRLRSELEVPSDEPQAAPDDTQRRPAQPRGILRRRARRNAT